MTGIGKLYIISAPSGAGKTSLVKRLLADIENLVVSISHTTRPIRPGETSGVDYFFVTESEFLALLKNESLLEHASVFGNFYGTAQATVEQNLNAGRDVILEIDWQGAQQIKKIHPESASVFILPPSTAVLEQRLKNRGQDDAAVIVRRMQDAVTEISHYAEFDYLIVNENFEQALAELKSIIVANRLRRERQTYHLKRLIDDLLQAS